MARAFLPLLISLFAICGPALASEARVRLGAAEIRYDAARWTAEVTDTAIHFSSRNAEDRDSGHVSIRVVAGDARCTQLAERAFELGPYDLSEIRRTETVVGGVPAERFTAHTRCRNATPEGVVVCVKPPAPHPPQAYLLEALQMSCSDGRNPFSDADPLAEIAAGVTFGANP